jgi:hypothetical protein
MCRGRIVHYLERFLLEIHDYGIPQKDCSKNHNDISCARVFSRADKYSGTGLSSTHPQSSIVLRSVVKQAEQQVQSSRCFLTSEHTASPSSLSIYSDSREKHSTHKL